MTPIRPLWVYFLWTFLFLFCLYLLFHGLRHYQEDVLRRAGNLFHHLGIGGIESTLKEGMGETSTGSDSSKQDGIYKYYPDPAIQNYYREFRIGELADESVELYAFIKVDKELVDASNADSTNVGAGYDDYKQGVNELAIYKTYNSVANSYEKYMDRLMGKHFDADSLAELTKSTSKTVTTLPTKEKRKRIIASFSKDLVHEDAHFQTILTNCGFLNQDNKPVDASQNTPLTTYFGELTMKYVDGKEQLNTIKKAFYELMKPVVLMQYLCDNYAKEEDRYKTADGKAGKNDSANYFLNTMAELLKKIDLEKSNNIKINSKNCIHVFTDDKDDAASTAIPLDAVRIFYYTEFNLRMNSLLPNSTTLQMNKDTFVSGFPAYLAKKTGHKSGAKDTLLTFLIQNPPVLPKN